MKDLLNSLATPLASIFGSGFLVIVPILAGAVGPWSPLAMIGICLVAFAVGAVVRHNIRHAEPALARGDAAWAERLEKASDVALFVAYVVSVCLYLRILSAFVLSGLGADSPGGERWLTTAVIAAIVLIGVVRGLGVLEALERWALIVTVAVIALLLAGFGWSDWQAWRDGGLALPEPEDQSLWRSLTIVAGALIVVQGFETTRYLGDEFDAAARIRAARWSQIISGVVYVAFVALALPLTARLGGSYGDDALLAIAAMASALLVAPLVVAAALSQFSAAVADTISAAGTLRETTGGRVAARLGYVAVGAGAVALAWTTETFEIVAVASRCFAVYYLLQCAVAFAVSRNISARAGFTAVGAVLAFVAIFAVPAG